MNKISKALLMGSMFVGLGGCASSWDVAGVAEMPPTGSPFTQALHQHYVERATFEQGQGDWQSVRTFLDRARMAAAGTAPAPLHPATWGGIGASDPDLMAAHGDLVAALATTAPQDAPDACARAQVWFEHWSEQREEGHQFDHMAESKAGHLKGMATCAPTQVTATPAPAMTQARSFMVHFAHDSSALLAASRAVLRDVMTVFKTKDMTRVEVVGHTDTSGTNGYNDLLSQRRATVVRGALVDMGLPGDSVTQGSRGESQPTGNRGDGVEDASNRRAEIIVRP